MAVSFFDSKAVIPDDTMVADVLAESFPLWDELYKHVQESFPVVSGQWKHYGKASGWSFKILSKKRTLLYFIPQNGYFRLRFGISEKVVPDVEVSDLPGEIKEAVRIATPYMEGRSIDLDISHDEVKVMAYVKDRKLVEVGTVRGVQLDFVKTLVQITN